MQFKTNQIPLVITLTLQSTSGDIQEGETECWNTESWKEQGCAWMMAATLSWDSCPFKDNTFKISDGGISPMHCLTPSTSASNICFPKGFFWKERMILKTNQNHCPSAHPKIAEEPKQWTAFMSWLAHAVIPPLKAHMVLSQNRRLQSSSSILEMKQQSLRPKSLNENLI